MDLLTVEHLTKTYGTGENAVHALDDVSFSVPRGQFLAIIGPSGSGKSTLLHILGGVDRPTSGHVYMNGEDVYSRSDTALAIFRRREVGLIYQFYNLIPVLNVVENITLPVLMDGRKVNDARLQELLDTLGLRGREKHLPNQLSGGQLQRIAIARALVLRPDIMVLDEPTSALDISVQAQILNLLLDLQEHFGLTYLIITHDLNVLRYISDRIAVMYLGKLMEFGPTETISSNPLHPYTHGLMAASPILDPTLRSQKKELMGGETGSLINLPKGCRFAARCPHATDRCREELPKDYHVDALHQVSCFLYDK